MKILGLPSDVGDPRQVMTGIVREPIHAVGTYRLLNPLKALGEMGVEWDCYTAPFPLVFELVREFDAVIMQRQTQAHHLILMEHISMLLKGLAIYDFDDDLLDLDKDNNAYVYWGSDRKAVWEAFCRIRDAGNVHPELVNVGPQDVFARTQQNRQGFIEMLNTVDLITVSNQYLAYKYGRFTNKPIEVVPNGVRFEDWVDIEPKFVDCPDEQIVIGWAGSPTHKADIRMIVSALVRILDNHKNVGLAFVGYEDAIKLFPSRLADRIHCVPFLPLDEYKAYVAGFDIGIAPAANISQNRGKSPIRVFELGMCCVPVVASEMTYGDVVPDGCGYVAKTVRQFEKYLEKLVRMSSKQRQEMGHNLHKYVLKNHEVNTLAAHHRDVLVEHLGRKGRSNGK